MEPQQDEGKERDWGAQNTRRQRQPRARPRRRSSSQPRAGEHGNGCRETHRASDVQLRSMHYKNDGPLLNEDALITKASTESTVKDTRPY